MITIVPTIDTLVAQPRIRLVVTSDTTTPNPVAPAALSVINRIHPDGSSYPVLLVDDGRLSGGSMTEFDYHVPFNQAVYYTVTASGVTSDPAGIVLPSAVSWIQHPLNPSLSVQIDSVYKIGDIGEESTAVLSRPHGASKPKSIGEGVRQSQASQIIVNSDSEANLDALRALFGDSGPVLLNLAGPDLGTLWRDVTWAWVSPGQTSTNNPFENLGATFRRFTIPYTEVIQPAGTTTPTWTVADVRAQYATVAAVRAAFSSVSDLATNTVGTPTTGTITPDPYVPGFYLPTGLTEDPTHPRLYLVPGA